MNIPSVAFAFFITPLLSLHLLAPRHLLVTQPSTEAIAIQSAPPPSTPLQPSQPNLQQSELKLNKAKPSTSSYAIIQSAQQPKSTQQLPSQLAHLRNNIQKQSKQLNNSAIRPFYTRVTQLKQNLSTAVLATLQGDIDLAAQIKSALSRGLEHIAAQASQAAEQLKQPQPSQH